MLLIWGSRGKTIDLGPCQTHYCHTCERDRSFHILLHYRYWHLYYIFAFITRKLYLLSCDACGRGPELNAADVEQRVPQVPIPFMHRRGLLVLIGMVASVALLNAIAW